MNTPRRALVVGAQGVLGSVVVRALDARGWEVLRGGRRTEDRPDFRLVDLDRPDTFAAARAGVDVVVNVVPHAGLPAEAIVLAEGGVLINISALPAAPGRLLRDRTPEPRGTVVMNAGLAPGVTNLVAADLLAAHPDADAVELVLTLSASGISGRAGGEFVHRHLTTARRHPTAAIPLPPPFGERRCLEIAERDEGWLGDVATGRHVATYLCLSERGPHRALLAVNRLGLMSALPRAAFVIGRGRIPDEVSMERAAEWVAVLREGTRLAARTVEADGDYRSTAAATVVLAEALLEPGRDLPAGCFHPEELFAIGELEPALGEAGIRVVAQPVKPAAPV